MNIGSGGDLKLMESLLLFYPSCKRSVPVCIIVNLIFFSSAMQCNAHPCDTGSSRADLEADPEFSGLDFSNLTDDWNSNQGFYGTDSKTLAARAKWCRRWLRERPEQSIVVVAHGDVLRYITDGRNSTKPWGNTEVREYTFKSEDDEDAAIVPVQKVAQEGGDDPTSSSKKFTY
jgi:hypothetical protein